MNLNKELTMIRTILCTRVVNKIKALLTEVERMPTNTCASAIHPRIIYDSTLMQYDIRKRVFIIVHEYLHIAEEHGGIGEFMVQDVSLKGIPKKRRINLLLWALEIWTNVRVYMLLGFKPVDLKISEEDLRTASMPNAEVMPWCIAKVKALHADAGMSKRIGDHMAKCYGLPRSKRSKARK